MFYRKSIFLIIIIVSMKFSKQLEIRHNNLDRQLTDDINLLKNDVENLQSKAEKLHTGLNMQTDIVQHLNNHLLSKERSLTQCDNIDKFFKDLDANFLIIKQSLHQTIKDNDVRHKNKINLLLQNSQNSNDYKEDNEKAIKEMKNKILQRLGEFDQFTERLQVLNEKLSVYNKTEVMHEKDLELDKSLSEIYAKVNSQEEKLQEFEEQLPLLQNISNTVENYLKTKKDKTKCSKGKCVLYRIFGIGKSLNVTSIEM